ncbi:MAG: hypothetical protein ABII71_00705 [Candidatus Micrarchaeota archaeon]
MPRKRYLRQIALREVDRPKDEDVEEQLDWICECLGLSGQRNELAREIFRDLIIASRDRSGVSTREIKEKQSVTQAAVVYHLNIFQGSGLIIKQGRRYYLRSSTLEGTLEEMEQDMIRRMARLRKIARIIEERF